VDLTGRKKRTSIEKNYNTLVVFMGRLGQGEFERKIRARRSTFLLGGGGRGKGCETEIVS